MLYDTEGPRWRDSQVSETAGVACHQGEGTGHDVVGDGVAKMSCARVELK